MPQESSNGYHVYHLFVVRTKKRNELQKFLGEQGVSTGLHYPKPLHLQPAYSDLGYAKGSFPVSEAAAEECLSLPIYAELTDEQVRFVAEKVASFFKK